VPIWSSIPDAPIEPRAEATAAWAGEELLVWGGIGGRRRKPAAFVDGAAYDLARARWRSLPPAPLAPRSGTSLVWAGDRTIVWGGTTRADPLAKSDIGALADGAAYLLEQGRWRRLPAAPLAGRANHVSVWTGVRLLVWGGDEARWDADRRPRVFMDGALYSPEEDAWIPIAPCPLSVRFWPTALWTGDRLLVFGGVRRPAAAAAGRVGVPIAHGPRLPSAEHSASPGTSGGAAYNPAQDRWTVFEPPEIDETTRSLWIGDRTISLRIDGSGLDWQPDSRGRREIAPFPEAPVLAQAGTVCLAASGGLVVLATASRPHPRGWLYDPRGDIWTVLPPPRIRSRTEAARVSSGPLLFVWGGIEQETHGVEPTYLRDGAVIDIARRADT
jgi:hypothetical protein